MKRVYEYILNRLMERVSENYGTYGLCGICFSLFNSDVITAKEQATFINTLFADHKDQTEFWTCLNETTNDINQFHWHKKNYGARVLYLTKKINSTPITLIG